MSRQTRRRRKDEKLARELKRLPIAAQESHSTTRWYNDGTEETHTKKGRKYDIVTYSLEDISV